MIDKQLASIHKAGHLVICTRLIDPELAFVNLKDIERPGWHDCETRYWTIDPHGEITLENGAEDYRLRHAAIDLAGIEAVRQLRPGCDAETWAKADVQSAVDSINAITDDHVCRELYMALVRRRVKVMVTHYRPEIEVVADDLLKCGITSDRDVRTITTRSLDARGSYHLSWWLGRER